MTSVHIKVVGVGNLLWADEGFGVRCIEALADRWEFPPEVELLDGGTLGLGLVPLLQEATHVLLFDTVDHHGEPGSLILARDREIPRFMGRDKMSVHQVGMNDVLASLEMLGHRPAAFTLIGVKPVNLAEYGGSLAPEVRAQLPQALELALAELERWGAAARLRRQAANASVLADAVSLERYETERPPAGTVCRNGDERFLALRAAARRRARATEEDDTSE